MSEKYYCGIDPGRTGAVALIAPGDEHVTLWDMPFGRQHQQRFEIDTPAFKNLIRALAPIKADLVVTIESVWARPPRKDEKPIKTSPQRQFSFGWTLGAIQTPLELIGFDIRWLAPNDWQKALGIGARSNQIQVASEMYPDVQISRKDQASALLIAHAAKHVF